MSSFKRRVEASEGDYELPPGGSYLATFVGLIDLGTQPRDYEGKHWEEHKIVLAWEIDEKNSEGENFIVIKDYTFSLHEKANLRKMIEAYSGKALADDQELDLLLLLGKPCVLSLSEGVSSKKQKFVNVTAVSRLMKGQTAPKATRKIFIFDFEFVEDPRLDPVIPDYFPPLYGRKLADDIKRSPEWQRIAVPGIPASAPTNGNGHVAPMTQAEVDSIDLTSRPAY
jgi:hypothetical protein